MSQAAANRPSAPTRRQNSRSKEPSSWVPGRWTLDMMTRRSMTLFYIRHRWRRKLLGQQRQPGIWPPRPPGWRSSDSRCLEQVGHVGDPAAVLFELEVDQQSQGIGYHGATRGQQQPEGVLGLLTRPAKY